MELSRTQRAWYPDGASPYSKKVITKEGTEELPRPNDFVLDNCGNASFYLKAGVTEEDNVVTVHYWEKITEEDS